MAVLGFNIGTRGTPVLVDDEAGSVLAATADHQPFAVPQSGRAEKDPHDWCQAAVQDIRHACNPGLATRAVERAAGGFVPRCA
jgi:sugar (pentulose or hexulose) kinase